MPQGKVGDKDLYKFRPEIRELYNRLILSEITTRDWQRLENTLLYEMPKFKTKWDVVRAIYNFLKPKYGEKVAINVTWQIAKYFRLIFQKYEKFWGLSSDGLELFEELAKFEKYHAEKPKVATLDLFLKEGVRA